MKIIALFFPAIISICIYCKRQLMELSCRLSLLTRYMIYVMVVNWCSSSLILYIFGINSIDISVFESFGFFNKYIFIATFFAWIIPYIEEITKKYIHICFKIKTKSEEENEDIKRD